MESDSCLSALTFDNQTFHIDFKKIDWLTSYILDQLGLKSYEVSLDFTSPEEIRQLNERFRNNPATTDVLSFPQQAWDKPISLDTPLPPELKSEIPKLLGDIAISLINAKDNANAIGQDLDRETCFLIIHGILHLCGHDHVLPDEERLMLRQQQKILNLIEENSPIPWKNCVRFVV